MGNTAISSLLSRRRDRQNDCKRGHRDGAHARTGRPEFPEFLSERGEGPRGKPKTEDDVAAQIDPVITFLRGGLDALKEPRTARRR